MYLYKRFLFHCIVPYNKKHDEIYALPILEVPVHPFLAVRGQTIRNIFERLAPRRKKRGLQNTKMPRTFFFLMPQRFFHTIPIFFECLALRRKKKCLAKHKNAACLVEAAANNYRYFVQVQQE